MDSKKFLFVLELLSEFSDLLLKKINHSIMTINHSFIQSESSTVTYSKSSYQSPLSFKFKSQLCHAAFTPWSCNKRDTNKNDSQASMLTGLVNWTLRVVRVSRIYHIFVLLHGGCSCSPCMGCYSVASPTTTFHVRAAIHFGQKTVIELN